MLTFMPEITEIPNKGVNDNAHGQCKLIGTIPEYFKSHILNLQANAFRCFHRRLRNPNYKNPRLSPR